LKEVHIGLSPYQGIGSFTEMRIGLFVNNLDEEYQISIYKGVKAECLALGIDLLCIQGEIPGYSQEPAKALFPSREYIAADGILILSSVIFGYADPAPLSDLKGLFVGLPIVSIGSRLFNYPSIIIKWRNSMERLMKHLVCDHGYRKLLYIGGPENHPDNIGREGIFRQFIHSHRKDFPALEGTVINGGFHETSGMTIVKKYITGHPQDPPDVIVAANDNMAIGAQRMLQSRTEPCWYKCPVTGFDDVEQSRLEIPSLTTVRQPLDRMGKIAVQTLRDKILGKTVPSLVQIESELLIRNSCGCRDAPETAAARNSFPVRLSAAEYQSIRYEYNLRNVSTLGQSLVTVYSIEDMLPPLRFFLSTLDVKNFYLFLYPRPLRHIGETGNLVYLHSGEQDFSYLPEPREIKTRRFFTETIGGDAGGPSAWCLYHLQSGDEYLGVIVYEAHDMVHPQICGGAIFIANTVKRLRIMDDEKEHSRRLEEEVAFRTRDLLEANKKLREEGRRRLEVEAEVLRISEMERLRFSLDLHDDICQRLAGISLFCKSLTKGIAPESFMPELTEFIDETLLLTRRYAHESFPMELNSLGLREALASLCHTINKQGSCNCTYTWSAPEPSPLTPAQDINLYRIIQEALQNILKHAKATEAGVEVRAEGSLLIVRIRDNGVGPAGQKKDQRGGAGTKPRKGMGLRSMEYRANQLGAEYAFKPGKTGGALVEVRIPLG
jgi:signal transduction histidine kinase/DNA-binding LacI/PurR family transcriptional regulator